MPRPVVLVVDDEKSVREAIKARLQVNNFHVLLATDPETAREQLEENFVTLAIVDLRLRDPNDPADRSGQELAIELTQTLVLDLPVIILTAYRDLESVNAALQQTAAGHFVIVVAKQKGAAWIEEVKKAKERSPINVGLQISRPQLRQHIKQMETATAHKRAKKEQLTVRDMEELLRRLFRNENTSLRLQSLLPGRSDSGIVLVEPSYEEEVIGALLVVKYGERESIKREADNYQRYVEPYILPRATVQIGSPAYTREWGAIKYMFVGASEAVPTHFESWFKDPHISRAQLTSAVRELFDECCQSWYRGVREWNQDATNLREIYREELELEKEGRPQRLEVAVRAALTGRHQAVAFSSKGAEIEVRLGQGKVETLPNPLIYFQASHSFFPSPSYTAITHGDLHARNILVDSQGHPWLIDFFRTGWGHALRDAAELESVVKFELLDHKESLLNTLKFEAALINAAYLEHARPGSLSKSLDRVWAVVREIRSRIAHIFGSEIMPEYRAALFFYALRELSRHPDDSPTLFNRRAHALYLAALIAKHLRG
jgi:CheY-like chemotaxis protein